MFAIEPTFAGCVNVFPSTTSSIVVGALMTATGGQSVSLRELANGGAHMFYGVSYLQVGLICLLTPVFMAGAMIVAMNLLVDILYAYVDPRIRLMR